jgi:hypothetical protein
MTCPECDSPLVPFAVPPELREYVPDERAELAICTRCLSLHPSESLDENSDPDFSRISEAFPQGEAAIPMALMLGLLESLALYRAEIEQLLERVERRGTDPLLVIDRLAAQGSTQPRWDPERRRHQLEQFLE